MPSNRTDLEDWIVRKALVSNKQFVYPFHLGWRRNIAEFLQQSLTKRGLHWATRDGAQRNMDPRTCVTTTGMDEYAFTAEQLRQKGEKAQLKRAHAIIDRPGWLGAHTASIIGIDGVTGLRHGCCVVRRGFPWLEQRIDVQACGPHAHFIRPDLVQPGDAVCVWNERGAWLYGEKVAHRHYY